MSYKVNTINNKGKEVWKYVMKISTAWQWQLRGTKHGLNSIVYQRKNGKYSPVNEQNRNNENS